MNDQAPCINIPSAKNKNILYVEILRIICIVLVIFNHTNYLGYVYFLSFDIGSLPYWFYMVFSVITGISIPMFFMISGMLLLGKTESIGYMFCLFSLYVYSRLPRLDLLKVLSVKCSIQKMNPDPFQYLRNVKRSCSLYSEIMTFDKATIYSSNKMQKETSD